MNKQRVAKELIRIAKELTAKDSKIDALRNIVKNKSMAEVDGVEVDMQTANAIVTVCDALSKDKQKDYAKRSINQMANIAWKLLKIL